MNATIELLPIREYSDQNEVFLHNPLCRETVLATTEFYRKIGFVEPWIGYFCQLNGELVGSAGFKGKPVNGSIEIAYGTFEEYRNRGIGSAICKAMVALSQKTDPIVRITARTLPEENFSVRILKKNHFVFLGTVNDPEDGEVWEWLFLPK